MNSWWPVALFKNIKGLGKKVKVVATEGLTPERIKEIEDGAVHLRMHGRALGQFYAAVGEEFNQNDRTWPRVLEDERLGVVTVPANFEGLAALLTQWDARLLDEEYVILQRIVSAMTPMGLIDQKKVREARAVEKAAFDHIKEEHPEQWERMQGWRV